MQTSKTRLTEHLYHIIVLLIALGMILLPNTYIYSAETELKKEVLDYLILGKGTLTNKIELKVAKLLKREAEIYLKLMDDIGP